MAPFLVALFWVWIYGFDESSEFIQLGVGYLQSNVLAEAFGVGFLEAVQQFLRVLHLILRIVKVRRTCAGGYARA